MTNISSRLVPLAVRCRNNRFDGNITGYIHGTVNFNKVDPGGYKAANFVVSRKLGYRSDIIQPYSRIYFYDRRTGNTIWEGDVTHPGHSVSDDGALLEVQVDGSVERLNDWSGARIYVDRDMQAWAKTSTSVVATNIEVGDDRGGSGLDALTLAFPTDLHVDTNFRCEGIYTRILESGQTVGRFDYTTDDGHTSGSPGWLVRMLYTPPSTVARSEILNVAGHTSSPQNIAGTNANVLVCQLIWTSGASSTGTSGNDIVWTSLRGLVVVARLFKKDGTNETTGLTNAVTAARVWGDMLGDMLAPIFDGVNATVDVGTNTDIFQLVYPDGTNCTQIANDLLTYEPGMTYLAGASNPVDNKYSLQFVSRATTIRYEALEWMDIHQGGAQEVEQYNEVATRWKTPVGNIRMTVATQSIPEMSAVGRTRRFFQDLGQIMGDASNVTTANATVLQDHRYPANTGSVVINRPIVDLFTGRYVQPYEIEPSYLIRLVGVAPSPDVLNWTGSSNGAAICKIVQTSYNAQEGAATLDLDSLPYSVYSAIRYARRHFPNRNRVA